MVPHRIRLLQNCTSIISGVLIVTGAAAMLARFQNRAIQAVYSPKVSGTHSEKIPMGCNARIATPKHAATDSTIRSVAGSSCPAA